MKNLCKRLPYTLAIAATFWSATSRADVTYTESSDDKPMIVRMNVTPAAEPVPALKYRLVSRDIDLKPGNAAPYYYRAFLDLRDIAGNSQKEFGSGFDDWGATGNDAIPLDKLPVDKVRKLDQELRSPVFGQLAVATAYRDCDWQLNVEDLRGPALVEFLLGDFQSSRNAARALAIRTRLEVFDGKYQDAINTMRMNYRLAVDSAKVPFLVCGLIGIAEASYANGTLTELIAAPNSPNMYWALTELPQPLIDLRGDARFELEIGLRIFPYLQHAETADHAPQEWNRLYKTAVRDLSTLGSNSMPVVNDVGAGLAATAFALVGYPHAKEQLIAQGMDRDKVEQMAVGQVIAIYTERSYQRFADAYEKIWYLPFWQINQATRNLEQQLTDAKPLGGGADRELLPIATTLLPTIQGARAAQVRLERDIAALRVIEALRMYAASHAGQLPDTLDDIREVPIPLNPATGKPFMYHLEGDTAVFVLPHSDGLSRPTQQFEIKIVQAK